MINLEQERTKMIARFKEMADKIKNMGTSDFQAYYNVSKQFRYDLGDAYNEGGLDQALTLMNETIEDGQREITFLAQIQNNEEGLPNEDRDIVKFALKEEI